MARPVEHGVRQLEMERSRHRHGNALSPRVSDAVANRVVDLAADRGGLEHYSQLELGLLTDIAILDGCIGLTMAEIERRGGIVTEDGSPLPVLKTLSSFANVRRLHSMALGLRRPSADDRLLCDRCGQSWPTTQYVAHRASCAPGDAHTPPDAASPAASQPAAVAAPAVAGPTDEDADQ